MGPKGVAGQQGVQSDAVAKRFWLDMVQRDNAEGALHRIIDLLRHDDAEKGTGDGGSGSVRHLCNPTRIQEFAGSRHSAHQSPIPDQFDRTRYPVSLVPSTTGGGGGGENLVRTQFWYGKIRCGENLVQNLKCHGKMWDKFSRSWTSREVNQRLPNWKCSTTAFSGIHPQWRENVHRSGKDKNMLQPCFKCTGPRWPQPLRHLSKWIRPLNTLAKRGTILLCHISPYQISPLPNFHPPGTTCNEGF